MPSRSHQALNQLLCPLCQKQHPHVIGSWDAPPTAAVEPPGYGLLPWTPSSRLGTREGVGREKHRREMPPSVSKARIRVRGCPDRLHP
eukprot:1959492-Alexandrium_andersonii.AAC.1